MARTNAGRRGNQRVQNAEPGGLWHQPALMNLLADVLTVLAVAGLAWAGLTMLQRLPVFPLREVVLTAAPQRVPADQIAHAARSAVVGNFFTVDLEATRAAFEKLPWVRVASVRRLWPDGLSLTLEEHEAKAQWGIAGGETRLVNAQGEVFAAELPEDEPGLRQLPRLAGPDGSAAELLARHAELNAALAGIGRRAAAVALSPRRAWQVRLDDGIVLELGRDQERHPLAERLARFVAHYAEVKAHLGDGGVADMRYPGGFALAGAERLGRPARTEAAGRKS